MRHRKTREGDEYACTCGLRWGVTGDDPHGQADWDAVAEAGRMMDAAAIPVVDGRYYYDPERGCIVTRED